MKFSQPVDGMGDVEEEENEGVPVFKVKLYDQSKEERASYRRGNGESRHLKKELVLGREGALEREDTRDKNKAKAKKEQSSSVDELLRELLAEKDRTIASLCEALRKERQKNDALHDELSTSNDRLRELSASFESEVSLLHHSHSRKVEDLKQDMEQQRASTKFALMESEEIRTKLKLLSDVHSQCEVAMRDRDVALHKVVLEREKALLQLKGFQQR